MIVSQFSEIQTTHHLNHSFFLPSYIRHIGGTNAITVHFVFIVALYLSLPSPFFTLCGFNCIFKLTSNYIESKPDNLVIFAVIRKIDYKCSRFAFIRSITITVHTMRITLKCAYKFVCHTEMTGNAQKIQCAFCCLVIRWWWFFLSFHGFATHFQKTRHSQSEKKSDTQAHSSHSNFVIVSAFRSEWRELRAAIICWHVYRLYVRLLQILSQFFVADSAAAASRCACMYVCVCLSLFWSFFAKCSNCQSCKPVYYPIDLSLKIWFQFCFILCSRSVFFLSFFYCYALFVSVTWPSMRFLRILSPPLPLPLARVLYYKSKLCKYLEQEFDVSKLLVIDVNVDIYFPNAFCNNIALKSSVFFLFL